MNLISGYKIANKYCVKFEEYNLYLYKQKETDVKTRKQKKRSL